MVLRLHKKASLLCVVLLLLAQARSSAPAQTPTLDKKGSVPLSRYIDQTSGLTADDLVAYGLEHNLELQAMRKEIDAAKALVKQARLRANPKIDLSVSQNVTGIDHNIDANAMLPLELGGRRAARIAVAERQVEVREREFANRERLRAAGVRKKRTDTLDQIFTIYMSHEIRVA